MLLLYFIGFILCIT